jgi:hypothetical protein
MAGLKKSKRQKDTGSPNIVLVIFLIVFVLSNLIFGLWLYFAYEDRNKALTAKTSADKQAEAHKKAMVVYQTVADDLRLAMGQQFSEAEKKDLDTNRQALLGGQLQAGDVKNIEAYKKAIEQARNDLEFDPNIGEYKNTYMGKYKDKSDEVNNSQATLKTAQTKLKETQELFKTLADKQDTYFAETSAKLDKEQKATLKDVNKQTDEMAQLIKVNQALNAQIIADDQKARKNETQLKKQIKELQAQITAKEQERTDTNVARDTREPHALLLDISLGKPLWDDPVGMITRVDAKAKEVTINLGSSKGVRPDLTFNVFAPSKYAATRAEKQLKGTIEVSRVLGPNSSVARITSTFDADFPMHEGDLLFNLFWGTRVAVTGYPNVTGIPSDSPSEQMRQLGEFIYLLERQGMVVDAYLDLTDGQIKGAIGPNTRFLIRGDDLLINAKDLENKEPGAERALAVNNGIIAMRKEAIDRGLFVISAKNFAGVIGYRQSGAGKDQTPFRTLLPTAGSVVPAITDVPARAEPPMPLAPPAEKKDEKKQEKKEKAG